MSIKKNWDKWLLIIMIIFLITGGGLQLYASHLFGLFGFGHARLLKCQRCGRVIEQYDGKVYKWQLVTLTTSHLVKSGEEDCEHDWGLSGTIHTTFSSIPQRGTLLVIISWGCWGVALGGFIMWLILRCMKSSQS